MSTEQERAALERIARIGAEDPVTFDEKSVRLSAAVGIARAALAAPQVPAVPQWHAPAERLVKWLHCMSYNESYFGEPAGYLKQCVNELRHLLPPHELKAAAPSAAPQPAEPHQLVSDTEYLRLFAQARAGSDRHAGTLRGIRACIAAYEDAAPAERVPLTDEQLLALLGDIDADTKRLPPGIKAFARAVESAHGIKPLNAQAERPSGANKETR